MSWKLLNSRNTEPHLAFLMSNAVSGGDGAVSYVPWDHEGMNEVVSFMILLRGDQT